MQALTDHDQKDTTKRASGPQEDAVCMQSPAKHVPAWLLSPSVACVGTDAVLGELTPASPFGSSVTLAGADARLGAALAVLERVCRPPEPRAFSMGRAALACAKERQRLGYQHCKQQEVPFQGKID